jgi:hypothetical protein
MSDSETDASREFETRADAGEGDAGLVKLWLSAIHQASKEEENWRKEAETVVKRYRQEELAAGETQNRFNILFASVETTVPALYNSVPVPDVRRRFGDKDETAKVGAQIIERAVSYMVDGYDFDDVMETAVRDNELVGRAVTRVRYVPYTATDKEIGEQVVWEEAVCEHVPWANFRRGPGKTWAEIPWIAFELFLTRKQLLALSPELGGKVNLDVQISVDDKTEAGGPPPEIFKRARAWEIWDKERREVLFIAPSFKEQPLKVEPDPLGLMGFYPIPRPLYAIKTSDSLVPIPLYRMFKHQAEELDRVTQRIMALVSVLKWRGIRDGSISEFENLKDAEDGELVPMQDAAALYAQAGGLEKAVWMLPIDKLITVVRELSLHREEIKQVIFEITGIADIMRGQTDPRETKGAQQIKTQWGSLRIQRRQAEVARYARDLFRMKAEIISNKFSEQTLQLMTGIQLPSQQEKQQAQAMMQAMQAQQQAQQAAPQPQPMAA